MRDNTKVMRDYTKVMRDYTKVMRNSGRVTIGIIHRQKQRDGS